MSGRDERRKLPSYPLETLRHTDVMKVIAKSGGCLVVPAGWRARIIDQHECDGTIYFDVEMTPQRWKPAYWIGRLRMAFGRHQTIRVD